MGGAGHGVDAAGTLGACHLVISCFGQVCTCQGPGAISAASAFASTSMNGFSNDNNLSSVALVSNSGKHCMLTPAISLWQLFLLQNVLVCSIGVCGDTDTGWHGLQLDFACRLLNRPPLILLR